MSLNQDCSRNEASQQLQVSSPQADHHRGIPQRVLLTDRKYDQIMSCIQNDLADGHTDKAAAVGNPISISSHKRKPAAGDVEEDPRVNNNYSKKLKCVIESSSSPGSNSSDVTTEAPEFMAESSKSSGFDDACTFTDVLDKSGASTSELIHSLRIGSGGGSITGWDLNGAPVHAAGTTVGVDDKAADEDEDESCHHRLNKRAAQAGKSIEYYSSQDSWLQLGLGPSSRIPNVPPAARSEDNMKPQQQQQQQLLEQESQEYFPVEEGEVDVSGQPKELLHLFPSESFPLSGEYKSSRMPSSSTATHHFHLPNSDTAIAVAPPARQSAETSDVFYSSIPPARLRDARPQEFTRFLKPVIKEDLPDTQLVISYSNNKAGTMYATGGEDHHHVLRQSRGLEMFGEPIYSSTSSGFPGSFSGYPPPYDSLGFHDFSGRRPELYGQPSAYSWKHEASSSIEADYSPNLYATGSRLNMPSSQPGEDWQTLIKRLGGGNLQFQSLFPGMTKIPANSSADHGMSTVEDLQRSRRPLQDFHPGISTPWPGVSQAEVPRAPAGRGSSWSRQLFGAHHHQDVKPMPFKFPSFQEGPSFSSRPSVWPNSGPGLLPFLPPTFPQQHQHQHQQQLVGDHFHHHHHQVQQQQHHHHQGSSAEPKETPRRSSTTPVRSSTRQEQNRDIWFSLRAGATNQDRERLPQVPKGYLRVRDGSVPVSHVKKYLVHKLGLTCESEVEICCRGQILLSSVSLQHVRDVIWYSSSAAAAGERDETSSSSTSAGKNIVMELIYRRPVQFNLTI